MEASPATQRDRLVRDIMQHGVPTVHEDSLLPEILQVFKRNDARVVVVVDEFDETSGLISEMDLLEHYRRPESLSMTAEDIMEEKVFTAAPTARIQDVAALMLEKNIEHLVIVHGQGAAKLGQANRPVALVSARNVVKEMAETTDPDG